jgi:hypothetical protein
MANFKECQVGIAVKTTFFSFVKNINAIENGRLK